MNSPPFKRILKTNQNSKVIATSRLVDYKIDNWQPELSPDQLTLIYDKGASVNIYIRPSNEIKNRVGSGSYIENYELVNFQKSQDRYLCFTDGKHLERTKPFYSFKGIQNYYCYSNCGPGFYNYGVVFNDETIDIGLTFMNKVRYEEMEWIVKNNYELIYEGNDFSENPTIIESIQKGKNFRIALTLSSGIEVRQDVDLLFYYPEKKET